MSDLRYLKGVSSHVYNSKHDDKTFVRLIIVWLIFTTSISCTVRCLEHGIELEFPAHNRTRKCGSCPKRWVHSSVAEQSTADR